MNVLRANTIRHPFGSANGHIKRAFLNNPYRSIITTVDIPKLKNPSLLRDSAFINNEWTNLDATERFDITDPATGKIIGDLPDMGPSQVKEAINVASKAFDTWSLTTGKERHDMMLRWAQIMKENVDDLATIITWENGKAFKEAKGEVMLGIAFTEWFAEEAVRSYGTTIPSANHNERYVTIKQPMGVVGIVSPWNLPSAMITRKGAAIAAGCSVVIKPAPDTPFSALALCELAKQAGFPPGVFNVVPTQANTEAVGKEMCKNTTVKKISFTGSTAVGKILMEQAASTMKKISMELGGNAPFIIFDDANIDSAIENVLRTKYLVSGQTCISANRIFVHSKVYKEFSEKLAQGVSKYKMGHGFHPDTTHGPLINYKGVEKTQAHFNDAVSKGAQVLTGGTYFGGNFFEPTVLGHASNDMMIHNEETFGPVAALYEFEDEHDVVAKANKTNYGLASYFFSRDLGRCWRVAEKLQSGMVGVNTGQVSNVYAPFGGVKESGIGKEGSSMALDEYMDLKFINMVIN
ncbi:aldehyde dehydrogenase [Backusella circina FSU 941]|nr:aldehyde dehydrogenase [Backusella circina FSU 941]